MGPLSNVEIFCLGVQGQALAPFSDPHGHCRDRRHPEPIGVAGKMGAEKFKVVPGDGQVPLAHTVEGENPPPPLGRARFRQANKLVVIHALGRPGPEVVKVAGCGVVGHLSQASCGNEVPRHDGHVTLACGSAADEILVTGVAEGARTVRWEGFLEPGFGGEDILLNGLQGEPFQRRRTTRCIEKTQRADMAQGVVADLVAVFGHLLPAGQVALPADAIGHQVESAPQPVILKHGHSLRKLSLEAIIERERYRAAAGVPRGQSCGTLLGHWPILPDESYACRTRLYCTAPFLAMSSALHSIRSETGTRGPMLTLAGSGELWGVGIVTVALHWAGFALRFPLLRLYEAVADMPKLTGYSPAAAALFLAVICALWIVYLRALLLLWRGAARVGWAAVFLPAAASAIGCALTYPFSATDVYAYIMLARIWTHHHRNPLLEAPASFPQDPFARYVHNWAKEPSPYGPFWTILSAPAGLASEWGLLPAILAFKGLNLLAYLGSAALIWGTLRRLRPGREAWGALLFAWNPLVLLDGLANAHNDMLVAFFLSLCFWFVARGRRGLASGAVVLAGLVKYVPLLLLPALGFLWLRQARSGKERLQILRSFALSGLLALAILAPFWQGPQTLACLSRRSRLIGYSPGVLLYYGWRFFDSEGARAATLLFLRLLLLLLSLRQVWQLARGNQPHAVGRVEACLAHRLLFWAAYLAPFFNSWYLLWPLALAPLEGAPGWRERTLALSAASLFGVALYGYVWPLSGLSYGAIHLITVPVIFGLPLAVARGSARWLLARRGRH
jgi:hypothetical protein